MIHSLPTSPGCPPNLLTPKIGPGLFLVFLIGPLVPFFYFFTRDQSPNTNLFREEEHRPLAQFVANGTGHGQEDENAAEDGGGEEVENGQGQEVGGHHQGVGLENGRGAEKAPVHLQRTAPTLS